MRIIKFLLSMILLIAFLSGLAFLGFREIILFVADSQIKGALKTLRQIKTDPNAYYYKCREKGGDEDEAVPEVFQLRFTSNSDYQLEVICRQFPFDPIVVDQRKLPFLINKSQGSSGLVWGKDKSALGLEIWGRKSAIVVKDEKMTVSNFQTDWGKIPATNCQGYGFKCCQEETSIGVGQQLSASADCPRSCFASCQSRPIILSFASDPFYDTQTKTITVGSGEEINFSYVVDPGDAALKSGKIDFGDGEDYEFFDTIGRIAHSYTCRQSACNYQVSITAIDVKDTSSAATSVAKIVVKVL
jgi:hypothetical protein